MKIAADPATSSQLDVSAVLNYKF